MSLACPIAGTAWRVPQRCIVASLILTLACFQSPSVRASGPQSSDSHASERIIAGPATAVDGDGLEIGGKKIRLFGIDAPEVQQYCRRGNGTRWHCGQYATVALDGLIRGERVTCTVRARDRYGRVIASCSIGGRDLAAEQVRDGWALAYRIYSNAYVAVESDAAARHAGMWAGPFMRPWTWRQQHTHRGGTNRCGTFRR